MDKTYRVIFEECHGFRQGETVTGAQVANDERALAYLLDCGAIVPAEPQPKPKAAAKDSPANGSAKDA